MSRETAPSLAPADVSYRLAAIVASSDDAIISKDLNGIVTSWNDAAERIFGYSAEEMIGRSIRTIIPDNRQNEEDTTLATIRRGDKVDHFETVRRRKTGELITISLTVSPVRSTDGQIIGASKIARDITHLKAIEAERFRLLEETASITKTLNEVGATVASDLERTSMVEAVSDAATELTGAEVGGFFYNVRDDTGEPTFPGTGVLRSDDITQDPRRGPNIPHRDMPRGHLPVRSYLAVPVKGRVGKVIGGLCLGHSDVGRFSSHHERLAVGIAQWASVALENARLYQNAQEASRLKDDFLASLSHELRTPLNAILGYARIVRSGIIGPHKHDKAIETIERNANALAQIVEDVLDVSRITSGKMRLNVQPVDLPDVVEAAIDAVAPAADAKGVRVETVLDPGASPISGDPDRLQQIFWNLLTNAVKFTPRGGKVQVRLECINSHVEIAVSDTGVGIAPEFIPHLFERFRQADTGTTRERGGLGLGLAIARQLVEMHGGTIDVSSAGRDRGATFRVNLPLMIVHPVPRDEPRVHPRPGRKAPDAVDHDLHNVHVLAVDDDRDALSLLFEVLEAAGARVTIAHSAAEALAALEADPPDVLVADLGMPHVDGFELIARVRKHADANVRDVPAAALTAYARSEDRVKALRAGFQIHLAKPIEPAELTTTVAALANRFR
jgi:PAS domain S-box-containing protein